MSAIGRRPVLAVAVVGLIALSDLTAPPTSTLQQPPPDTPAKLPVPSFTAHWTGGELQLSGHTLSEKQEQSLMAAAQMVFPDAQVQADFEPLGVVPKYWPEATAALPALLHSSVSGSATLTESQLRLDIISAHTDADTDYLDDVLASLPSSIEVHSNVVAIDNAFSVQSACAGASAALSIGPIAFLENSTILRTSSYPRLDRIAALAVRCDLGEIKVVGHTDSSGSEEWNRQLSLHRADIVSNYLVSLGVDADRLQAVGLGSAEPIASNATRYGRSINRRIEIEFLYD